MERSVTPGAGSSPAQPRYPITAACYRIVPRAAARPLPHLKQREEGERAEFNLNHISQACSFLNQYCFLHHI